MKVFHLEDIGPHYATTLTDWRRNFLSRLEEVERLGDVQMLLAKPGCRLPAII